MPKQKPTSSPKSSFNYIAVADLIVVAGILVIASRPDGLAITISAAIVAAAAGLYRCVTGIKSLIKPSAPAPVAKHAPDRRFKPPAPAIGAPRTAVGQKSKSWLRESD